MSRALVVVAVILAACGGPRSSTPSNVSTSPAPPPDLCNAMANIAADPTAAGKAGGIAMHDALVALKADDKADATDDLVGYLNRHACIADVRPLPGQLRTQPGIKEIEFRVRPIATSNCVCMVGLTLAPGAKVSVACNPCLIDI